MDIGQGKQEGFPIISSIYRVEINLAKIPFPYKEEKKCLDYNLHVSINLPSEVLAKTFRWKRYKQGKQ